jgi:hypothetical protein
MENSGSFKVGDRVAVKVENAAGNPRTPKYIRGKKASSSRRTASSAICAITAATILRSIPSRSR